MIAQQFFFFCQSILCLRCTVDTEGKKDFGSEKPEIVFLVGIAENRCAIRAKITLPDFENRRERVAVVLAPRECYYNYNLLLLLLRLSSETGARTRARKPQRTRRDGRYVVFRFFFFLFIILFQTTPIV